MRLKKKAVSPLIATVLLIAFAVALGAVVMNWGRTYVEETAEKAQKTSNTKVSCSMDVNLKYVTLNGRKQICYNESEDVIRFTLQNSGSKTIEGIDVQVIGAEDFYITTISNSSIRSSFLLKTNITYDFTTYGDIQKVSLIPKISVEGENDPVPCSDNSLDEEDIATC
jgi:flagellin-like protein